MDVHSRAQKHDARSPDLTLYVHAIFTCMQLTESVTIHPPKLPKKGLFSYWAWAYYTLTIPDSDLLMSCGLDALVLTRLPLIGVQIFLPIAVLSLSIRECGNMCGTHAEPHAEPQACPSMRRFVLCTCRGLLRICRHWRINCIRLSASSVHEGQPSSSSAAAGLFVLRSAAQL